MKKFLFVVICLLSGAAFAAQPPALKQKNVDLPDAALVAKVEGYLNSLKTFEADFGQATIAGDAASGKFYLQRGAGGKDGKFRWEYIKGQQVLIINNGSQIIYYDKKLDEVTYIPMQYSIASFLAAENIKLSGSVQIVSLGEVNGSIRLIVTQAKKPDEGSLALYFAKAPMKLTHLEAIDPDGNITAVAFRNQKENKPIDKDKFVFKNPKFYKEIWDRK